jgi:predicted outer membrane repeat protein
VGKSLARSGLVTGLSVLLCFASATAVAAAGRASALAPLAHRLAVPLTSAHFNNTYLVTTTIDAELSGSAPVHACQDEGNAAKCSLRAAISAVDNDFQSTPNQVDEIKVPAGDFELNPGTNTASPEINEPGSLLIAGAGYGASTIDGSTLSFDTPLLSVDDSSVNLDVAGLAFKGGDGSFGGAIDVDSGNSVDLADSAFDENQASVFGGAVFLNGGVAAQVTGSIFASNLAADNGGAIDDQSESLLSLSDDRFEDNEVTAVGPTKVGGAVFSNGPVDDSGSGFSDNTAGAGGALYASSVSLDADTFTINNADDGDGGAIYATGSVSSTASVFSDNTAIDSGGAIVAVAGGDLSSGSFQYNGANVSGGDIDAISPWLITATEFAGSTAGVDGGSIVVQHNQSLSLANDNFLMNVASGSAGEGGGAIYAGDGSAVMISGGELVGDSASGADGSGGAVFCSTCTLTVNEGALIGDDAQSAGGAIFLGAGASAQLASDIVSANKAAEGGGIAGSGDSDLTVDASSIDSNQATFFNGGGIYFAQNGALTLYDSTASGNESLAGDGGAIAIDGSSGPVTASLLNDTIAGNRGSVGTALWVDSTVVTVASSTVYGNAGLSGKSDFSGLAADDATVNSTDTIWADNSGAQCAGSDDAKITGSYNLVSDASCAFSGVGNIASVAPNLAALATNGGPTETAMPQSTSAAIANGGASCPDSDQRGQALPQGAACDIGSVYVQATTTRLAVSPDPLRRPKDKTVKLTVTVETPESAAGWPSGKVVVKSGGTTLCTLVLTRVTSTKAHVTDATCALASSRLSAGTRSLAAEYLGHGITASSVSPVVKVKVIG